MMRRRLSRVSWLVVVVNQRESIGGIVGRVAVLVGCEARAKEVGGLLEGWGRMGMWGISPDVEADENDACSRACSTSIS